MPYFNCPFEAPLECCTIPCYLLTYVCHLFLGYTGTFIVIWTTRFTWWRPNCWSSSCGFPLRSTGVQRSQPPLQVLRSLHSYLKGSRERPALGRKVRIELIPAAKLGRHANKNNLAHHHYTPRRHAHLFISIRLCRACVRETRNYTTWKGGDRPGQFPRNPHGSWWF